MEDKGVIPPAGKDANNRVDIKRALQINPLLRPEQPWHIRVDRMAAGGMVMTASSQLMIANGQVMMNSIKASLLPFLIS